jgi:hypothetical protein
MLRRALLVALIAALAVSVAAQTPAGWKVRIDGSPAASASGASANLKISPTEKGFHVSGGPGAVIWDPAHSVKPIYRVRATFTTLKPSDKPTYYGLFIGGTDMEGATPSYVYFAIAQDGTFLVRHREGDKIDEIDKSLHYAIRKPDASGKSVNTLDVQVAPTAVSYVVNGAVATATPTRSAVAGNSFTLTEKIGGIVGVRIDDSIEVQVDNFFFESPFQLNDRGQ